jgi:hypothetical protein
VSDVLVLPLSLLIRGILAALRQIFHLSACPNLPGHLWVHRAAPRYALVYRSIEHRDLRTTCDIVKRPSLPAAYQDHGPAGGFVANIRAFAESVTWLQERRHAADYFPGRAFIHVTPVTRSP